MDEAAFRSVYERTAPRLRAYLYVALRDFALADDLLQEAFYRLLRAGLKDANIHQTRSYLYKTALTLVADQRRRAALERDSRARLREEAHQCPEHDLALDMEQLFGMLPARQQTLLWLAHVEGASHREIGAAMGIGEKSVRVLLHRARKRLAGIFEDHGWGLGEVT